MKCFTCRGLLKEHTYNEYHESENCTTIVRDIPCEKCTECGELAFDLKTGVRVEEIIDTLKGTITGKIAVVQYSEDKIDAVQYTESAPVELVA